LVLVFFGKFLDKFHMFLHTKIEKFPKVGLAEIDPNLAGMMGE
jgi:hypothetical protein